MNAVHCVDGIVGAGVPADDRGLAYGDGVFETVLLDHGVPVWWDRHLQRLAAGAAAFGLAAPAASTWEQDLQALLAAAPSAPRSCVLKLVLTRGSGGRGYATNDGGARRIASLHPVPVPPAGLWRDGLRVRWCEFALAVQPRLAGHKHLNRLEQVLARREWDDPAIAEGLVCDADGWVISATAANLFVVRGGEVQTPRLDRCGIHGVCRRFLLEHGAVECRLRRDEVESADEVFLCNSVRGILPVGRLGERRWTIGPRTRALQSRLAAAVPTFASDDA